MADFSRERMIHAKLQLNFMNTNSVNSFSLGSFVLSFFLSFFLFPKHYLPLSHHPFSIAGTTPHKFEKFSAQHPVFCYECENVLWGLARQGLKCTGMELF